MAFAVVHLQDSPAKTPNYAKNGKNNMKEFIALHNRTVSRDEIQTVIALAKEQNNTEVIYRLSKILNDHPDSNRFNINIINYPQETTQQVGLAGTRHSGDYREALDECGRLKKGWHFVDGKVVKTQPKPQKATKSTSSDKSTPSDLSSNKNTPTKTYTAETFAKDLDFNTLKRSYSWISFDPDARAERDIKQWGEIFYSLYNSLSEEAKKQGVLEAYNTAFDNGYTALLKLEKEIIATRSKTFSTAITGGAGITEKQVSTNEKRMRQQSEKSELWNQKYDKLHKLLEKIAKNKPADLYEEGDVIKSTDNNAMTKLQQKLKMLQDRKTMLKNGVVAAKEYRKNKDLSVFKKYNIDKETTDTIVKHIDNGGSPTEKGMYNWFTMPYLNRDIKEVEKRIAILEKNQSQGEKETLIEGGKIVYNGEAQRLQIFFDGIPSKEVREALKANAFKWAPTAKAWQRTLTENAKYAVNQYLLKTGILKLRTALAGTQHSGDYREALDDCGRLRKGWHFVDGKVVKTQPKKAPKKASKSPSDKSAPSDSSSNKNIFLEEYRQLKAKYPEHLIIVSMEDQQNYTMYGKDAFIAADILNLQLLKGKGNDEFSNSVGFKYNYLKEYLEKLVKAGYKVAVRGNDLDKPQSSPQKNKTTKPSNPTKTPIAPTDPMSNELLYFNSVPQRQLVTRIKAKSMKLDFEDEYYNNIADKDGYFKPDFQNKSNLKIITDNCDNFVGTINTYDYPIISAPKPKTTGIMSLKKIVSKDNLRPIMTGVYIDKNHYIATDAHKIVFIPRPKNDEYRTGTIFDINFKCKKLGGCKTEEALIDGHFPIEIINKMKSEENSYISPPLNIENVISHLYCGEKAINIFTTYEKYKVITLYFEKERKTNYINIKHLLDTLEVLRSNGAKTFTLGFLNLEGKRQINIDTDNKLKAIIMPNYYQVNENPTSENCIMIAPINLILYKQFRPKKGLSVPTDGTLFGTLPTFKTRKEAKKYFKAWAAENLTGKKVYHKELDKYVVFSSRGIDHVLSSNISFNKMKLILQAEEMLKNSHLIAFEEDYKKRENIKGVYRMCSNAILEGEDIKVILTLREGENGVIYYDHKIEEIKESTTPPRKSLANPFCGDSAPANTPAKTVPNSALSAPEVFVEHSPDPATQSAPSITPRNNSIANKMAALQNRTFETFIIAEPQMQAFLGDVERKNTGSTAITITGGAGSGKTRFAFQFINALAQNYKVGHASLEEQPDSKLYFDKVHQYLDETAQANVEAPEIENMQDLQALIERNDVIVIDSFTKIREWNRNFLLDRDLRKKYNGKLFLIIFQQTVAGNMRGGTTSEFDGDIILYTQVFPDYRENYIYPSKNRYNSTPSEQLRYSVYHQQLLPSESTPPDSSPVTSNTYEVIY